MRIIDKMLCLKCNLTNGEKAVQDLSEYKKVRYWLLCLDLRCLSTVKGESFASYDGYRTWFLKQPSRLTVAYPYGAILYDFEKEDFILASTYDYNEDTKIFFNEEELEFVHCTDPIVEEKARETLRKNFPFIGSVDSAVSSSEQIYAIVGSIYRNHYLSVKTESETFRINLIDLPSIAGIGMTFSCMDGQGRECLAKIVDCLDDRLLISIDGIKAEIGTGFDNQPDNVSICRFDIVGEDVNEHYGMLKTMCTGVFHG